MSPEERQRRVRELIGQARVAMRRAQHHMDRSAERVDFSQVLLLDCADRLLAMNQALEGSPLTRESVAVNGHRVADSGNGQGQGCSRPPRSTSAATSATGRASA